MVVRSARHAANTKIGWLDPNHPSIVKVGEEIAQLLAGRKGQDVPFRADVVLHKLDTKDKDENNIKIFNITYK